MTATFAPPFDSRGTTAEIEHGDRFTPLFDASGLIPAVASDAATGEVLMLAWMNADALARTLATGEATFWSRSRGQLWKKGEDSGNVLRVVEVLTDCDQDALVLRVVATGHGVACHTGARSCFYRRVTGGAAGQPLRLAPAAVPRPGNP